MISAVLFDRIKGLSGKNTPQWSKIYVHVAKLYMTLNRQFHSSKALSNLEVLLHKVLVPENKPREANIKGLIEEHLPRGLSLSLAFLRQNGEIRAPLDSSLRIPRALPVPHQHHSLRRPNLRERRRNVEFRAQLSGISRWFRRLWWWRRLLDFLDGRWWWWWWSDGEAEVGPVMKKMAVVQQWWRNGKWQHFEFFFILPFFLCF